MNPTAINQRRLGRATVAIACSIAGLWAVYFVLAPTVGFGLLDSWHDEQRFLQVLLLVASMFAYLYLYFDSVFQKSTFSIPIWAIFACGLASAAMAKSPVHAFTEVSLLAQLALLTALSAGIVRSDPERAAKTIFALAWVEGLVYIAGVFANYAAVAALGRGVDSEVFLLGYANPRFASALFALILPFICWLACYHAHRAVRISSWCIAPILWLLNLVLGTRAIWLAYLVGCLALWIFGGVRGRRAVKPVVMTAVIGVALYFLLLFLAPELFSTNGSIQGRSDIGVDKGRPAMWYRALTEMVAHPILGIGPMQYAIPREWLWGAHPHNWLLQIGAEWGLVALAILLFVCFTFLRRLRVAINRPAEQATSDLLPPAALSVVTTLFYGLVDGNWVMPVSQSLAFILLGCVIGLSNVPLHAKSRSRFSALSASCTAFLALAASITLVSYVWRTVGDQERSQQAFVRQYNIQFYLPRFWQQGLILDQKLD